MIQMIIPLLTMKNINTKEAEKQINSNTKNNKLVWIILSLQLENTTVGVAATGTITPNNNTSIVNNKGKMGAIQRKINTIKTNPPNHWVIEKVYKFRKQ